MTGAEAMAATDSEEVTSKYTEMTFNNEIDAIKQNRGQLSFRSRKMLNVLLKTGGAGQVEKKITAPVSARDVKLEVIANPPEQLSVDPQSEVPSKKILEPQMAVRTVAGRNGSSVLHGHRKDRGNGKPPKTHNRVPQKVVICNPAQTPPMNKNLLPARLKLLETFYEGLEAAISLLAIRRQMCTFKSVCKTVEQMSKRRFLRSHLAQMKFLFPEVIEIDYVRVLDQDSRRDMWDLRIILKVYPGLPGGSPMNGGASPSRDKNAQTLRRKREFHSRLVKFASSHDEDLDVPQDPLPQRPLGGQPLSSPEVSAVNEKSHHDVAEDFDPPEAEVPLSTKSTEEVYEFSILKAGSLSFPDIDFTSHFPPSFRPHFQERGRELNFTEEPDSVDYLDIGVMSHFAPSFKPQFQERHRELSSQPKSSSGAAPSEVHIQTSAVFSRTITRFPTSFERHFSKRIEEGNPDDSSQPSQSAEVQGDSGQSSASHSERVPSKFVSANLNFDRSAHGEKTVADVGEAAAAGDEADAHVQETSTIFSVVQSPARKTPEKGELASSPAEDICSLFPTVVSPLSRRVAEYRPLSPTSGRCATPASSASGTADGVPNTPCNGGIGVQYSPAVANTPASLSPSRHYRYVLDSPISEHLKGNEASPRDPVPVRSQGTIRSLKFGSPIKPPRPPQRHAEELAPKTPQVEAPLESTPRDESKYDRCSSSFLSPQETTREASREKSSYFSPVRLQSTRALRFSTPEKDRVSQGSGAKLGTPNSSDQQFKSPQTTSVVVKPPRFMSPPNAQSLCAPATPIPQTPVRSILYSPPKRTKFNRGSLFSSDEPEEEVQVRLSVVPDGDKAEASMGIACEIPETRTQEDSYITPVKDSPSKTRKALNVSEADLVIIDSLPAELVLSVREKERKIKDENTKELMLQKRRHQMMAGLPKLFNQLRMIFQSLKRSVLQRNELIKNVLSTNPDITDRGEVEERLKLLIELAPDWISKQPSANGDYIYRINKSANVTKIQKKILEAC